MTSHRCKSSLTAMKTTAFASRSHLCTPSRMLWLLNVRRHRQSDRCAKTPRACAPRRPLTQPVGLVLAVGRKRPELGEGGGLHSGMPACGVELPRNSSRARGPVRSHTRTVVSDHGDRLPRGKAIAARSTRPAGLPSPPLQPIAPSRACLLCVPTRLRAPPALTAPRTDRR
jgi:hypothetical protein